MLKTVTIDYSSLEQNLADWEVQSGKNVNPVQPIFFQPDIAADKSLRVTNYSPAGGGALVTCKPQFDLGILACPYVALDLDAFISSLDARNVWRFENDVKTCLADGTHVAPGATPPLNGANFSVQWNASTKMWEIDKAGGGWAGTGYPMDALPVDEWLRFSMRGSFNLTTYSVLSLNCYPLNETVPAPYQIPAAMQNCPLLAWAWTQATVVQLQTEVQNPGLISPRYRNIRKWYSSQPIP